MKEIEKLREKIAELSRQANNQISNKGDSVWTNEEQKQFDGYMDEINRAKIQIKSIEALRNADADKFFTNAAPKADEPVINVAMYLRLGNNVNAEQATAIRNAMSTTTQSEGGYTVPSKVASMVIETMKAYGGMRGVAEVIPTENGASMSFPTSDGTSEEGEIVGENTAASAGDITFGAVALAVYKYSSKKIALPVELVQDSGVDIVGFVINRLATRLARITNKHYTVGTGSSQPYGLTARAGTGKTGATGQTLTVTYDDLVDLKYSVNSAYRQNGKWMMNDKSIAILSKLKDSDGRPIWTPAITLGAPDMLLGSPVITNDDMPVMAASAKSIAFGDLGKYVIRDIANSNTLRRFGRLCSLCGGC